MKNTRKGISGITLISLIITLIILLIVAGIAIAQLIGSGLFDKARRTKIISNYKSAKEIVELKLMEIQIQCIDDNKEYTIKVVAESIKEDNQIKIDKCYYENNSSIKPEEDNNFTNLKGIVVSVATYPEYKFLIGKDCKIEDIDSDDNYEDNMDISTNIKITLEKNILSEDDVKLNHYEFATIKATIEPIESINKITVNGKEIEPDYVTGIVRINVTENGTYKITAYGENNTYNFTTVIVKDLSENLEIWSEDELVKFEKSVNSGRTYKGKIITLKKDLYMDNIQWNPIGYYISNDDYLAFKGIFDGENHTINNLKINNIMLSNPKYNYAVGFMSSLEYGILKNVNFNNPYVFTDISGTGIAIGWIHFDAIVENVKILSGEITKSGANAGRYLWT